MAEKENTFERDNIRETIGYIRDFVRSERFGEGESIPIGGAEESFSDGDVEEGRALAILAYIPFLCFIPFVHGRKGNRFVYEHGKQGVLLFLFEIVVLISVLFWKVALFLASVAALMGIVYVLQGRGFKVPFIGELASRFDTRRRTGDDI